MTIPADITTANVYINAPISFIGEPGIVHLTITPSEQLVHASSGTPLVNFVDSVVPIEGEQAAIVLPHTDQTGFLDSSGNAYTDWYYTADIKYEKDGQFFEFPSRDFQIATGQDTVDLALVVSGTAAVPATAPRADVLSINGQTGIIALDKTWVGLDQVDDTSDVNKPVSTAQQAALDLKVDKTHVYSYADISGIVPTSALPPLAIVNTTPVSSQAAMLALVAQQGDIAIRTDVNKTFILSGTDPTVLANWTEMMAAGQVLSVAGRTGTVLLTKTDVGLANVDNTSDANKPVSTATQTALNGKEPSIAAGSAGQYLRGDKTFVNLDKVAVGLSNVDNTSDANKPVSGAQQTALDAKQATSAKGAANGYAPLDANSRVPVANVALLSGNKAARDALTNVPVGLTFMRTDRDNHVQTYTGNTAVSASGWEYKGNPLVYEADPTTFTTTAQAGSALIGSIASMPTFTYAVRVRLTGMLLIACPAISTGVKSIRVALSVASSTAGGAQMRALMAWVPPGGYSLSQPVRMVDWVALAANTAPLPRIWIDNVTGTLAVSAGNSTIENYLIGEVLPADD